MRAGANREYPASLEPSELRKPAWAGNLRRRCGRWWRPGDHHPSRVASSNALLDSVGGKRAVPSPRRLRAATSACLGSVTPRSADNGAAAILVARAAPASSTPSVQRTARGEATTKIVPTSPCLVVVAGFASVSSYAQSALPPVHLFLVRVDDSVNSLKQTS